MIGITFVTAYIIHFKQMSGKVALNQNIDYSVTRDKELMQMEEEIELTPTNYFEYVKDKRNATSIEDLEAFRENAVYLLEKFQLTGQIAGMKKLMFIIDMIEKEKESISLGIESFVYLEDIKEFIEKVADEVVKIIRLEEYPREVPDDIVADYLKVERVFDRFYVVFTDYTGEAEKNVEKSRRDKDPILFGAFHNKEEDELNEKFYYIGDWIDEYCDLTLDKMVTEMEAAGRGNIEHKMAIPSDIEELREEIASYVYHRGSYVKKSDIQPMHQTSPTKKSGGILKSFRAWWRREV